MSIRRGSAARIDTPGRAVAVLREARRDEHLACGVLGLLITMTFPDRKSPKSLSGSKRRPATTRRREADL